MNLVLLETSGNQDYIFSTNKLRENIGASRLTLLAGTRLVLEAVAAAGGPEGIWDKDPVRLRGNLADPDRNLPLVPRGVKAEVVVATSGKALVLVDSAETGRKIVARATLSALKEAPGLDLCGVVSEDFIGEGEGAIPIHEIVREVHESFEEVRGSRLAPTARFPLLPIVERCSSSGLPAADVKPEGEGKKAIPWSRVSLVKRQAAEEGIGRFTGRTAAESVRFPRSVQELEDRFEGLEWSAVVHADGNGIGQIMLDFHKLADARTADRNRVYVDKIRRFSLAIEESTEAAFLHAAAAAGFKRTKKSDVVPLVPLVLGGDDLTVICDGSRAVQFARAYLDAYESETAKTDRYGGIIPEIAGKALGASRLSSCAGVAVVKPHFPFFTAYRLAEGLLRSAKTVKQKVRHAAGDASHPCSALDFHVLFDASVVDLDDIRGRLTAGGAERLWGGPYVTTAAKDLPAETVAAPGVAWAAARAYSALEDRVTAVRSRDAGALPSSQLHFLREALFRGKATSDARVTLLANRYGDALGKLLESLGTLFRDVGDGQATRFLDALDLAAVTGEDEAQ